MNTIGHAAKWHTLDNTDTYSLSAARLQLHYAIQCIAAVGAALAEPIPDDSHVSMEWNTELESFVGVPIRATIPFRVALNPKTLTAMLINQEGTAIATQSLDQQTLQTALDWHKQEISQLGTDVSAIKLLDYPANFPDHALAHGAVFDAQIHRSEREQLSYYYANTHQLLAELLQESDDAMPDRIWPHHFDIASLIMLPGHRHGAPMTIGLGMSPGDQYYQQPYWYVSPYPYPAIHQLPSLSAQGFWHTQGWTGAILTASQLPISGAAQSDQVRLFLQSTWQIATTLLKA